MSCRCQGWPQPDLCYHEPHHWFRCWRQYLLLELGISIQFYRRYLSCGRYWRHTFWPRTLAYQPVWLAVHQHYKLVPIPQRSISSLQSLWSKALQLWSALANTTLTNLFMPSSCSMVTMPIIKRAEYHKYTLQHPCTGKIITKRWSLVNTCLQKADLS